jgi:hypothetical protein
MLTAVLACYYLLANTNLLDEIDFPSASIRRRLQTYSSNNSFSPEEYKKQSDVLVEGFNGEILLSLATNLFVNKDYIYRVRPIEGPNELNISTEKVGKLGEDCSSVLISKVEEFIYSQNGFYEFPSLSPTFINAVEPVPITAMRAESMPYSSPHNKILIVFTTCNQLQMTILSLQYMRVPDVADLLVVDDHSTDGTVEYLQKRGFAVITKPKPTGLTDSWNIGYRFAVMMGYPHLILMNNDVLLTTGAVRTMHLALGLGHALVAPLTTEKGAGHNPSQVGFNKH